MKNGNCWGSPIDSTMYRMEDGNVIELTNDEIKIVLDSFESWK